MSNDGIPGEVQEFLRENISSVDQLELLLMFEQHPATWFTAEAIAKALYLAPESASSRLEAFHSKGILRMDASSPPAYALNASGEWARTVGAVSRCYKERRVSVINYIYSNPIDTIQSFADAFLIKKKKD